MALKDWKKRVGLGSKSTTNIWRKGAKDIIIVQTLRRGKKEYIVEIEFNRGQRTITERFFKTKSQAMAFAMRYMRSH